MSDTVTVTQNVAQDRDAQAPDGAKRLVFKAETEAGALLIAVPFAPEESTLSAGSRWVSIDRPGAAPLLEWGGPTLPVLDMELLVGYEDHRPIEVVLKDLVTAAGQKTSFEVQGYHGLSGGPWRLTELVIRSTRLNEDQVAVDAVVKLQLTRSSDANAQFGLTPAAKLVSTTTGAVSAGSTAPGASGTSLGAARAPVDPFGPEALAIAQAAEAAGRSDASPAYIAEEFLNRYRKAARAWKVVWQDVADAAGVTDTRSVGPPVPKAYPTSRGGSW